MLYSNEALKVCEESIGYGAMLKSAFPNDGSKSGRSAAIIANLLEQNASELLSLENRNRIAERLRDVVAYELEKLPVQIDNPLKIIINLETIVSPSGIDTTQADISIEEWMVFPD